MWFGLIVCFLENLKLCIYKIRKKEMRFQCGHPLAKGDMDF